MKRILLGLIGSLVAIFGVVTPVHAGTNDFTIKSFDADYYLSRDSDNRSTLKTIERISAEFPLFDQNHGIERALPERYDGHSTSLRVESVTDANDRSLDYSTYGSGDNQVLRIGDADKYVHGVQEYIITYSQRDVTKYFSDTNDDEFYWDINGVGWQQPFGRVTARIHMDGELRDKLSQNKACYQGVAGSTKQCDVVDDGSVITVSAVNLRPSENVTVALGFPTGTFAQYEQSAFEKIIGVIIGIWILLTIITSIVGFVLIFVVSYRYSSRSNRRKEIGTVVAEYIPPKATSVQVAKEIGEDTRAGMTAQIIDLAVRHYLKIYQTQEKAVFKAAEYELEIVKPLDDLLEEERQFLTTLFGSNGTSVGARFAMKSLKNDYGMAAKMQKDGKALEVLIKGTYDLRHKVASESRWFSMVGWWALAIGIVTFSPLLLIAAVIALVCASQLYPLTDKGLDLRRYLMGLKLYIGVAEEERLKMLQSPEGAEKVGRTVNDDPKQLVKLYERVLPYAVLFGQEKEWNKQLGAYYEQNGSSPDWYAGNAAFNAAIFTSAMSDFGTSTNSYAASTSSSSGGSSGGGSSGGGGGGGGGGGW
jgi:uncharacterized membrane protein YgcG